MSSGALYVLAAHAVLVFAAVMYLVVAAMRRSRIARERELLTRLVERERERGRAPGAASSTPAGRER